MQIRHVIIKVDGCVDGSVL